MLSIYIVGYLLIVIYGLISEYLNQHEEMNSNIKKYFAYGLVWPVIIIMGIILTLTYIAVSRLMPLML